MNEVEPEENFFIGEVGLWGKVLLMALKDSHSYVLRERQSALLFLSGHGNFSIVCRALGVEAEELHKLIDGYRPG